MLRPVGRATFVFVYHRAGGMTYADRATIERHYNTTKRYPPKTAAAGDDEAPCAHADAVHFQSPRDVRNVPWTMP
ncbi:MAG: hypothetical protein SYR96_27430 [Actinomycetota bacterium]|nr:hypothetical protein [Actinomycetota bacterium]